MLQPINVDKEIDTRGLNCPLPILRAKRALSDMTTGQVLKIVATDPGSMRDFQAFSNRPATNCWFSRRLIRNSFTS